MRWLVLALSMLNGAVAVMLCVLVVTVRRQTVQLDRLREEIQRAFKELRELAGDAQLGAEPLDEADDDRRDRG